MYENPNFNGYPNNQGSPYYNPYYYEAQQRMIKKNEDKHQLKRLSLYAGGALLCYILLQNVLVLVLQLFGVMDYYYSNEFFQCGLDIFLSVICMFLPFCFFGKKMQKMKLRNSLREILVIFPIY